MSKEHFAVNIQMQKMLMFCYCGFIWICTLQPDSYIWRDEGKAVVSSLFMQKHNKSPAESHYCSPWSEASCWCLTFCSSAVVNAILC